MRHGAAHHGVFREAALTVVTVQCQIGAMVVLPGEAPMAAAASLERLDRNQITASEVLDSRAADTTSAQLAAE